MKSLYLNNRFKTIEEAIDKSKANSKDPQLAVMLSSYLAVFISGIYEDCIEYLFVQRAHKSEDRDLVNFVKNAVDNLFRNPDYKQIKKMLENLNPSYATNLRSKIEDKNIDGINAIVTNKNKVAHGMVSNATLNDIFDQHQRAIPIFVELESILL